MASFRWTPRATEAAQLVAEGESSYPKIAEAVGISRQTLHTWRGRPEFQARVDEHAAEYRELVRRRGIARLERRVDALNDRWNRMRRVIDERAEDPDMRGVAGGPTGLLVRTIRWEGSGDDRKAVYEYEVDVGLLRELREHEKQAAQELGHWTEKKEIGGHAGGAIKLDLTGLDDDELAHLHGIASKLAREVAPTAAG